MEMEEALRLAQSDTQLVRVRKNLLYTFGATRLPYICLSQSSREPSSVVVRQGEVMADKPQIAVPGLDFQIEGFPDTEEWLGKGDNNMLTVLLARRISLPPSKYVNSQAGENNEPGSLEEAIERAVNRLDNANDVRTAVISAPDLVWGLSILLYVGSQVARSSSANVQEHFEHLRLNNGL
ncbi:MAG: hypothetical protein LBU79_06760 [Planctomycetota bacterium]|nr:hypothetical protein [Planctomycetota bacterium]